MFWIRRTKRPRAATGPSRPRRTRPRLEALEDRCLLSASLLAVNPGATPSNPSSLVNVNGLLFFVADDGMDGRELWRSDGTAAGTVLVKDIRPGSPGAFAAFPSPLLVNAAGALFFTANDGVHGEELWKSDGTAAGTVLVKDIIPGSGSAFDPTQNSLSLIDVNGTLFFSALHPSLGRELWKSNGTAAGTVLVKDIALGSGWSTPTELTNVNGTLYFTAVDRFETGQRRKSERFASHGRELWMSDGTTAGTMLVKDIFPGSDSIFDPRPENLTNVNGTLFFTANAGPETGEELWKSDGTAAGTVLVKDIRPGLFKSSFPNGLTEFGGAVFFFAFDDVNGHALWKSDGSTAGTVLIRPTAQAGPLTVVGSTLFFTGFNAAGGLDLLKSDGTTGGTVAVKQILTAQEVNERICTESSLNLFLTDVSGTLYLAASDGVNGVELWKSDGTAAGTVLVADLFAGSGSSNPALLTAVNGSLFIAANDGIHGAELWVLPSAG